MQVKKSSYLDEYRIIRTLGTGYSAKVKLAETADHVLVAIKRFKPETTNLGTLRHELSIMKKLHHENLVNLLDVRENATYKKKTGETYNCFAIVLEYVGGGQLFDFIALGGRFPADITRTYFQQMINGLHYMHSQGYAHRDIKPENILLTTDFILKLADFGFTGALVGKDHSGYMRTKLGTEGYMAPEIQTKEYDGQKVDIFSAGVILFIMYTGTPPFEKTTPTDSYYRLIKDKNFTTFWNAHSKRKPAGFYTEDFKDLVNRMLAYVPNERITMHEIAAHPWAKGNVLTQAELFNDFTSRKKKIDDERERNEREKERKKAERNDARNIWYYAVNRPSAFVRSEGDEPELSAFLENYKIQQEKKRNIHVERNLRQGDYVIDDTLQSFFAQLITLISSPIELTIDELPVEFRPKFEDKGDAIEIRFEYENEDEVAVVQAHMKVRQTEEGKPVVTCHRVEGNPIYYKLLVNKIKNEFTTIKI